MYLDFKQQVSPLIEQHLEQFCEQLNVVQPLTDAVRYALFPAGKRIRPLLALACCRDLGGKIEFLARPACALELLHASSLIHDDLPALDNDDFRRGRPSCHRQFGEATAILTGDLLIAAAFALIAPTSSASDTRLHQLTAPLAQAFIDVCHGQQRDLMQGVERGGLEQLHRLKTGALFRVSMHFGALFGGADQTTIKRCIEYGEALGIYFQIVDDLIDLHGKEEQKGRPGGSDQRNRRETFAVETDSESLEVKRQQMREQMEALLVDIESGHDCQMLFVREIFNQLDATV